MEYQDKSFSQLTENIESLKLKNKSKKEKIVLANEKIKQLEEENKLLKQKLDYPFVDDNDEREEKRYTQTQYDNTILFINTHYTWMPSEYLNPDIRCKTGLNQIYNHLKVWCRENDLDCHKGKRNDVMSRLQVCIYLTKEHRKRYDKTIKWSTSHYEADSEQHVNGSRNIPYFHILKNN